jgi:signal transduction histidine kinase
MSYSKAHTFASKNRNFTMRLDIFLLTLLLAAGSTAQEDILEPARIRCNAAYSTPCSRTNSRYLAVDTARKLQNLDSREYLDNITAGKYNMTVGFYPFVFQRGNSTVCVAHGADASLVGLTLQDIFAKNKIGFSNAQALHQRFEVAASQVGGGWVTYLWSDGGSTNSKVAYVTALNEAYMLGVGYEDVQLPPNVPCSAKYDGLCSIENVRSLVGKAQFSLYEAASSLELFESVAYDISFLEDAFQIPGGFYIFMYNYDGSLKAHAVPGLHDEFGSALADIFVENKLGTRKEGEDLHEAFIQAAEGNGWVSYIWRDSLTTDPYIKVAKLVKVEFEDDAFYVGAGFNFATDDLPTGPLGEACTAASNLPCAFSTAFQLSSHALVFAISSTKPVSEMFNDMTFSPEFKTENVDFYTFAYSYNEVCQSHGSNPSFVGKTLSEVFDSVGIDLDGRILHEQFRSAAEQGGGFINYDWLDAQGNPFEKISYIFSMNLDGNDYYGGIGLNHLRAPIQENTESGAKKNGEPIPCSSEFGWECSEVNARAILGQALADLTLYSSNIQQESLQRTVTVTDILARITAKDDIYRVNNFAVSVFAGDQSGRCVASGAEPSYVGKDWQEILDAQQVTSIRGPDLQRRLINKANDNGGVIEYAFSTGNGIAKRKRAWTSRFRNEGDLYYVVAEYVATDPPATCDDCPASKECTSNEQAFCEDIPEPGENPIDSPMVKALIALTCFAVPIALCAWYLQRRKTRRAKDALRREKEENDRLVKQFEQQMQGMFEVKQGLPVQSAAEYHEKQTQEQDQAFWYWEESPEHIERHKAQMVLSGTSFVRYSRDISDMLEHSFQLYGEGRGFKVLHLDVTDKISSTEDGKKVTGHGSGMEYDVDFASL